MMSSSQNTNKLHFIVWGGTYICDKIKEIKTNESMISIIFRRRHSEIRLGTPNRELKQYR